MSPIRQDHSPSHTARSLTPSTPLLINYPPPRTVARRQQHVTRHFQVAVSPHHQSCRMLLTIKLQSPLLDSSPPTCSSSIDVVRSIINHQVCCSSLLTAVFPSTLSILPLFLKSAILLATEIQPRLLSRRVTCKLRVDLPPPTRPRRRHLNSPPPATLHGLAFSSQNFPSPLARCRLSQPLCYTIFALAAMANILCHVYTPQQPKEEYVMQRKKKNAKQKEGHMNVV